MFAFRSLSAAADSALALRSKFNPYRVGMIVDAFLAMEV